MIVSERKFSSFTLFPSSPPVVAMVLKGVARTHPLMTSSDKKHPHVSFSPPPSQTAVKMIIR